MLSVELLEQTRTHFPELATDELSVTFLEKGGSARQFYRLACENHPPLILVRYDDQKEENRHYVELGKFLGDHAVHVPKVYLHDEAQGLIWMEDLGESDLWAFRNEPWEVRQPLYQKVLDQAHLLHSIALPEEGQIAHQPAFDERLYLWEQNYFFENCLGRHFGLDEQKITSLRQPIFQNIAQLLASRPRCLVHRDFQSQNIMIRDSEAWLIDFQGLRPGLPQYDLASLLYDPYVPLAEQERVLLFHFYASRQPRSEDFYQTYLLCAMQRLMQALGAYGFLGYVQNRPHFLAHIPAALTSLRLIARRIDLLKSFSASLDELG